jgi:hypothetical protein
MIPSDGRVHLPVASPTSAAFPKRLSGSAYPNWSTKETSCGFYFEIVAIPYVQTSWFARHPDLPYRCALTSSQDSRDFYARAAHALLPMRTSGMLAA